MSTGVQTRIGQFIWHDLITTDIERAQGFYTELLGWELETWKPGEMDYPMIKANGELHGGFGPPDAGGAPRWVGNVVVEDVEEACKAAVGAGGSVRGEPGGHPEVGRWAAIVDPQGAEVSAFKPSYESPTPSGVFLWDELVTPDVEQAKSFYGAVFAWTAEDVDMGDAGTYSLFKKQDGENAAGLMRKRDGAGPAAWVPYLAADDVDATFAKAHELGAKTFLEPTDVEAVGRFAALGDPTGATFGLFKPV